MDRYEQLQMLKRDQARKVSRLQVAGLAVAGCALGYNFSVCNNRIYLHLEKHQMMSRLDNLILLEASRYALEKHNEQGHELPINGTLNPSRYKALKMWFETAKRSEVPAMTKRRAIEIINAWWPVVELVYEKMAAGKDISNYAIRAAAYQKNLKTFDQLTDSR